MCYLLTALLMISLRLPDAQTFEAIQWKPAFTEPSDLKIVASTVAMLTHSSRAFDHSAETQEAVIKAVASMKAAGLPVLYLHDQYNRNNPPWMYLYNDWNPTAYLSSDVGHFDIDLSQVEHVVSMGGYFGQCQRSTVTDVIRLWYRDGLDHDLRITQVVDGVFTVGQHIDSEDSYSEKIRSFRTDELRKRHPKAVLTINQIVSRIDTADEIAKFLQRQLPAVPSDVNVVMDVFGNPVPLQIISAEAPVLTFAYRDSNNFLKFEAPQVDWTQPTKLWRNRIVMKRPVVPVQAEGVPAIVPNSELPAVVPFLGPFNESLVVPRNPTTGPVFIEGTIVPPLYIESPPFYDGSSTIMTVPTQITIEP